MEKQHQRQHQKQHRQGQQEQQRQTLPQHAGATACNIINTQRQPQQNRGNNGNINYYLFKGFVRPFEWGRQ
jgi:hypothetical protein